MDLLENASNNAFPTLQVRRSIVTCSSSLASISWDSWCARLVSRRHHYNVPVPLNPIESFGAWVNPNINSNRLGPSCVWMLVKTLYQYLTSFIIESPNGEWFRPERWNHPEYVGMYIYRDERGLHLVACNALEASTHSGKVSMLVNIANGSIYAWRRRNLIFRAWGSSWPVPNRHLNGFSLLSWPDTL